MSDSDRARLLFAIVGTIGFMTGLGLYLAHREKIAGGVIDAALEHGEKHSMINAPATELPPEARFEVVWRCEGGPDMARVVYASDEADAVRGAHRNRPSKGCEISHAAATSKPYCNANRDCGAAYALR